MKFFSSALLLLLLGGLCAGFLNGLLGAGGGIVIVYTLSFVLKSNAKSRDVFANALLVMLPLSALSCFLYASRGNVSPKELGALVIPAITGGVAAGFLIDKIKTSFLNKLFAVLVVISGILLIIK